MTDYEAAYESVMKYAKINMNDVDSQEKLERYLRQSDYRNTMSTKFVTRISETSAAKQDIEAAREAKGFDRVREERAVLAQKKDKQFKADKRASETKGRVTVGSYTNKKAERYVTFKSRRTGKEVYEDKKGKIREARTGRFAQR